jgi:hypothetical protein
VDYEVETRSGTLSVTVPGPDPTGFLTVGTQVNVRVDPRRAFVLAGD